MDDKNVTDLLEVEGIYAKGFGMISKLLMQDTRISPEAKCIYAYFCSYAGNGTQAFPSVNTILYHLNIGKSRYYKHLKVLKEFGYIKSRQSKVNGGVFSKTIYTIVSNPVVVPKEIVDESKTEQSEAPVGEINTESNDSSNQKNENIDISTNSPCTHFRDTGNTDAGNRPTNNISPLKKSSFVLNQSISGSANNQSNNSNLNDDGLINHKLVNSNPMNSITELFDHFKISADELVSNSHYQEYVNLIWDILSSNSETIPLSKFKKLSKSSLVERLLCLSKDHFDYVHEAFLNNSTSVRNVRSYLLTSLFNSVATINSFQNSKNKSVNVVEPSHSSRKKKYTVEKENNYSEEDLENILRRNGKLL